VTSYFVAPVRKEREIMSNNSWEGYGGPVNMDKYDFNGIDPALDDCCRREVESNRVYNALTSTLSRHDVTLQAERRKRHVLGNLSFGSGCRCMYDPNLDGGEYRALTEFRESLKKEEDEEDDEEQKEINQEESGGGEDDSDDEFNYLLDDDLPVDNALEERRRAELEFAMLQQETALHHGYGVHRQMHPNRVLKAASLGSGRDPPSAVVLHLVDTESMKSASLDLILEDLAKTYKGTKFLRSDGRSTILLNPEIVSTSLPGIAANADMPCLVSIVKGDVVAKCARLEGLIEDDDRAISHAVHNWLDHTHALVKGTPAYDEVCFIRPEEEALLDNMRAAREREKEERFNCGLAGCCKTFAHEHVGIENQEQRGLVVSEETVLGDNSGYI